ncbi:5-formyltetrahydrofolate cyclo-ligase [hydrothermal vent metagenome]|uniref:5-formyltetrahydrofolate cyclo-ligase n=1 Tax=hydrothermal vent metagenome TaxID=652676 RepID=A0A1W1C7B4_9ZZZZ
MDKNNFRKKCLDKIKKRANRSSIVVDKIICNILYKNIKKRNSKVIMLYIPLKIEVDIKPLILRLRREGRTILVPFMEGESFRLVKYRLPLKRKKFGIKETKYSNQYIKRDIDISIVPILGRDSTNRRVGFGKGMYDRFFDNTKYNIKKVIFISRLNCVSSKVITNSYDIKANLIIYGK